MSEALRRAIHVYASDRRKLAPDANRPIRVGEMGAAGPKTQSDAAFRLGRKGALGSACSPTAFWGVQDRREFVRLLRVVPDELTARYEREAASVPQGPRLIIGLSAAFIEVALTLQQVHGRRLDPLELLVADSLLAYAASLLVDTSPETQDAFASVIQRFSESTAAGRVDLPLRAWLVDAMHGRVATAGASGAGEDSALEGESELALIEAELRRQLLVDPSCVADPMTRLIAAGGKRLRPILAVTTAKLGPHDAVRARRYAVALEFLHCATLVHDDYIDRSPRRRNAPSIAALEGGEKAVAVGDYYFAKAVRSVVKLERPEIVVTVTSALRAICGSQIEELLQRECSPDWRSYVRIARGKTGALFSAACAGGAQLSATPSPAVDRLRRYGELIGVAFQIVDDVIDFGRVSGKPAGQDVRNGTLSLPIRYALEDDRAGPELRAMLMLRPDDEATVERVMRAVTATGALERSRARAEHLAARALRTLSQGGLDRDLPALVDLVRMAVNRAA
jgi:geranylgeranyl pyrophosphate synthase